MIRRELIRPINLKDDLDDVIELWYESSLRAHDFIESSFWISSKDVMRELYIPMSKTMVLEIDGKIIGFISIFENKLAALFISLEYQGQGFGKDLLRTKVPNRSKDSKINTLRAISAGIDNLLAIR